MYVQDGHHVNNMAWQFVYYTLPEELMNCLLGDKEGPFSFFLLLECNWKEYVRLKVASSCYILQETTYMGILILIGKRVCQMMPQSSSTNPKHLNTCNLETFECFQPCSLPSHAVSCQHKQKQFKWTVLKATFSEAKPHQTTRDYSLAGPPTSLLT